MTTPPQQAAIERAAQYRKRPVVITATQWFKHGDHPAVRQMDEYDPVYLVGFVKSLEGNMQVVPGDWIITGIKGEHYPCKPDIFALTYESAELSTQPPTPSPQADREVSGWDDREIGTVLASIDKAYTAIHGPPMESDDADSRDPFYIGDMVEKAFKRLVADAERLRNEDGAYMCNCVECRRPFLHDNKRAVACSGCIAIKERDLLRAAVAKVKLPTFFGIVGVDGSWAKEEDVRAAFAALSLADGGKS